MKIETSHLEDSFIVTNASTWMTNHSWKGRGHVTWLNYCFAAPRTSNISGTLNYVHRKASVRMTNDKPPLKGARSGSHNPFFIFFMQAEVQPTSEPQRWDYVMVHCASPRRGEELVGVCDVCVTYRTGRRD